MRGGVYTDGNELRIITAVHARARARDRSAERVRPTWEIGYGNNNNNINNNDGNVNEVTAGGGVYSILYYIRIGSGISIGG